MAIKIFNSLGEWRREENLWGLVPTLGGLHRGHASLIKASQAENSRTVVSVFLNPTQFDRPEDLEKYPSRWEEDLDFLETLRVDAVIRPTPEEMYRDRYRYRVVESDLSRKFCGAFRDGHFTGVLTVVMKLILGVGPRRVYFGEKDFQQLMLVKEMLHAFFVPVELRACPTIREEDGLAYSSRHRRLSAEGRRRASEFPRILKSADSADDARSKLKQAGFQVDYVEDWVLEKTHRLAAVWLEGVRMIDHWELTT